MLHQLIVWYCRKHDIPWKEEGYPFLKQLQQEATEGENAQVEIPVAAQLVWTSAKVLRHREFCFILNEAVRDDERSTADATAGITRAINELCVTVPRKTPQGGMTRIVAAVHPPDFTCFRG
jgi:hypothetical protein